MNVVRRKLPHFLKLLKEEVRLRGSVPPKKPQAGVWSLLLVRATISWPRLPFSSDPWSGAWRSHSVCGTRASVAHSHQCAIDGSTLLYYARLRRPTTASRKGSYDPQK